MKSTLFVLGLDGKSLSRRVFTITISSMVAGWEKPVADERVSEYLVSDGRGKMVRRGTEYYSKGWFNNRIDSAWSLGI